jgi:uncharacterized protein (TIGR02246 family)
MRVRSSITTAALLLIAATASYAQNGSAAARAAIDASVARLIAAANHVNVDAIVAEFAVDVVLINGGEVFPNLAAIRSNWAPAFAALRRQDIRVEHSNVRFTSPTSAVYTGNGTFTATDTAGVTSAPQTFTWTLVYTKEKSAWKISSGHQAFAAIPNPNAESEAKTAIDASMGRMMAAASRLDPAGLVADATPDVRFVFGTMTLSNRDEFRSGATAAFKALRRHDVTLRQSRVSLVTPTVAEYTGLGAYVDEDTAGIRSTGDFAMTATYRRIGGEWKAVSLHESVLPTAEVAQAGSASMAAQYQPSVTAKFEPVPGEPNIGNAQLYGDANQDAPHAEFTKFGPGFDAGRHTHTNTVTIVVLEGAYLYRDEAGDKRVGPGEWLRIPGGKVHWSGGDLKQGATFYVHMDARMDQKPAQ